jgi:hypothetical protein
MSNVYDYWYSTQPKSCKGCECSHLTFSPEGDPIWDCELSECYQKGSITLGMGKVENYDKT